ncbi:MAG: adenylate/guanylate cyclase domain-containing protein [Acidimicrobiales bacterium]
MIPETRYARNGDVHIAYQVSGDGPIDVIMVPGFVSNVELAWEMPFSGPTLRHIGSFARVISFDKRGTGLSDRSVGVPTLEQRMDDVRAVMDAAGVERAALFGISEGGPMCILFAATYPARTSALVLQGSFARLVQSPDQEFGYPPEAAPSIIARFEEQWGTGAVFANFYPSAAHDPGLREQLARYERNGASPSAMVDIVEMVGEIDVRAILPTIGVPTLVVHSTGDAVISVEHGRYLAEHIAGARYIELTSGDHLTFRAGESGAVDDVEEFLTGQRPVHNPDRILTTVLFTDIVDSTRRAVELGDQRWRLVLDQHDDVMRQQLGRFGGREVNTTGDGFLAAFDGPARAVQCAVTVSEAVRLLGLEVRAGVHTGECEQRAGDLGGIGVHIGARVAALAEPSQVLVSRTVTDLVAGSGLRFTDRGEYELKGVPGLWQLFAVEAV